MSLQKILVLLSCLPFAAAAEEEKMKDLNLSVKELCIEQMSQIPGKYSKEDVVKACSLAKVLPGCESENGRPIFYFEKLGTNPEKAKKILTMSLIHGDEMPAGAVSRSWMGRLTNIESRNTWRVIPVVNPDGFLKKTRTNANNVDVNRNFPTTNWDEEAIAKWRQIRKSDPRRYPGPKPASEKETQCLLKHFGDFDPNFIISVHTPLGVLDFDGPKKLRFPHFSPLPWISLGNYPGSLGRYMWKDRGVPVLTIELKGPDGAKSLEKFDQLQDISGTVAIQSTRYLKRKTRAQEEKKRKNEKVDSKETTQVSDSKEARANNGI